MPKSPGGAIFPYYYKGGKLYGMHLGNYEKDETGIIALMQAEQEFFLAQKSQNGRLARPDLFGEGEEGVFCGDSLPMLRVGQLESRRSYVVFFSFRNLSFRFA